MLEFDRVEIGQASAANKEAALLEDFDVVCGQGRLIGRLKKPPRTQKNTISDIVHVSEIHVKERDFFMKNLSAIDTPGIGLHIVTVSGNEFDVYGSVSYKDFSTNEGGRVYYCAGRSWPEEIVTKILIETAVGSDE